MLCSRCFAPISPMTDPSSAPSSLLPSWPLNVARTKKERGFSAPLLERKNLNFKRESTATPSSHSIWRVRCGIGIAIWTGGRKEKHAPRCCSVGPSNKRSRRCSAAKIGAALFREWAVIRTAVWNTRRAKPGIRCLSKGSTCSRDLSRMTGCKSGIPAAICRSSSAAPRNGNEFVAYVDAMEARRRTLCLSGKPFQPLSRRAGRTAGS